ncbi:MAG TPA: hypothetical protein VGZ47_14135 [Gemmataceae bacterium]|jgi:hypothetical protein|nr:hypothetical protein [Gemmataceae bacterium]
MLLIRRFLVVLALMFWMGGFMFYGAVVVPTNRVELKDMPERGTITQKVTEWMNLAGTLALLVFFADIYASPVGLQRWRWIAWAGMLIPHLFLIWLHHELTKQMSAPGFHQSPMHSFLIWHRVYLITNTVQWFAGMVFLAMTLRQWRREDSRNDSPQRAQSTLSENPH